MYVCTDVRVLTLYVNMFVTVGTSVDTLCKDVCNCIHVLVSVKNGCLGSVSGSGFGVWGLGSGVGMKVRDWDRGLR